MTIMEEVVVVARRPLVMQQGVRRLGNSRRLGIQATDHTNQVRGEEEEAEGENHSDGTRCSNNNEWLILVGR